ncbi:hypothetical protein D3C71_2208870 [compost metagenome]
MQGVFIRAGLDPAEQSEGLLLGSPAVFGIDHLNAVTFGQGARAAGVLDLQVAAASGLAAVNHQFV